MYFTHTFISPLWVKNKKRKQERKKSGSFFLPHCVLQAYVCKNYNKSVIVEGWRIVRQVAALSAWAGWNLGDVFLSK